jgi:hypothetical protein
MSGDGSNTRRRESALDIVLAVAVVAVTVGYVVSWPHDPSVADEGLFLYESKRLLHGDRFYRDFFEIVPPGAFYFMAIAFALFGATMEVARAATGVVHGAASLAIFLTCRAGGVRRPIAAAAAVAQAVFFVGWPIASVHWFSAALAVVLLGLCLSDRWRRRAVLLGLIAGYALTVQQHKGVLFTVATGLVLVVNAASDRPGSGRIAAIARTSALFLAGVAAVTLPLTVWLVHEAGAAAVYRAVVDFPLHEYVRWEELRRQAGASGQIGKVPLFARWMLAVTPLLALHAVLAWRRGDGARRRRAVTLTVFSAAALLSVIYNLDYAHVAVIAAVWLVAAAELLEAALRGLAALSPRTRPLGAVLGLVALVALGWKLRADLSSRPSSTPLETPFGRIDVSKRDLIPLVEELNRGLAGAPQRELFGYPMFPWLYLLVDARNPTRYQLLIPRYNSPDQIQEAIAALESRAVPFVAVQSRWADWQRDEVMLYARAKYQWVPLPAMDGPRQQFALLRRRP